MEKKIVLVCTGNTCRSPMAEVLLRHFLLEKGYDDVNVLSAGLGAQEGLPAAREARNAVAKRGLSLDDHSARSLTEDLLKDAHLILTMTLYQKDRILTMVPSLKGKIFTLKEYAHAADVESIFSESRDLDVEEDKILAELQEKQAGEMTRLKEKRAKLQQEIQEIEKAIQELMANRANALKPIHNRRQTLLNTLQEKLDVADPFGQDQKKYDATLEEMESYVEKVIKRLENGKRRRKDGDSE